MDNKEQEAQEQTAIEGFLEAKVLFVRDPLDFKDKDKDGIDDKVDNKIG